MGTPQISSYYVRWLHDYVSEKGLDADTVLGPLTDSEIQPFYPMPEWSSRLKRAATALNDPDLGLNFGRTITPHRFGVLGYLLHHCDTLSEAFLRMQQYQRLLFRLEDSQVISHGDLIEIAGRLNTRPDYHAEVFSLTSIIQFARSLTGKPVRFEQITLMSDNPAHNDALERFMQCEVLYAQAMTGMTCSLYLARERNGQPDAALRAILETQANGMLAALPHQDDLVQQVRHGIVHLLQEGEPTLERVAQHLGMSGRTLHRRLAAQDMRFRELLEQTRRQLAESYLHDPRISLAEVALLLGYAEQSPFTHAFKRWTGSTPSDWRKLHSRNELKKR